MKGRQLIVFRRFGVQSRESGLRKLRCSASRDPPLLHAYSTDNNHTSACVITHLILEFQVLPKW
jgi:hypothetical protein